MTFPSNGLVELAPRELADFGKARVRDAAFDAVYKLWERRKAAGVSQKDLADILNRDPAWVSRQLSGPGNWTLNTFGELVIALNGEAEIVVNALEDQPTDRHNYSAYDEYIPNKLENMIATQNQRPGNPIKMVIGDSLLTKRDTTYSRNGLAVNIKNKGR